jgi:hypothetical protein
MRDGARPSARRPKAAYESYYTVLEEELNALYDSVENDFSVFYRAINEDDASTFRRQAHAERERRHDTRPG